MTSLLALIISLTQLAVVTTPSGAQVMIGLTPLGAAPRAAPVTPGVEVVAFRAGFAPAHRPARGAAWNPILRANWPPAAAWPPQAPAWLTAPCGACAVAVAEHPSPVQADTLARSRALAERVASRDGRLGRLDKVFREGPGGLVESAARQHAVGHLAPGRLRVFRRGAFAAARDDGGLTGATVSGLGAADVTAPGDGRALARVAATAGALRWWLAARDGVRIEVEHRDYQASDDGARLIEVRRALDLEATLVTGATRFDLAWALRDTEHLLLSDQVPTAAEGRIEDTLRVGLTDGRGELTVTCRGGACATADPQGALERWTSALARAGLTLALTDLPPRYGAAMARATLRGSSPVIDLRPLTP